MKITDGLDGVSAGDTTISEVDGERGRLIVRGKDVEVLAEEATFEQAFALLIGAEGGLGGARAAAFERLPHLGRALDLADGMDALTAAVAQGAEPEARSLAGAIAVYAAAWARKRRGEAPIAPDPSRGHAADYLHMVTGAKPSAAAARALDRYLVTVAEHGMNASAFAARVVASTGSDLRSAVVAAIGALKGPLHGGAPGPVLDMLDAIRTPENAEPWLEAELASGRRIMGMGHRIYRVRDPRAAVLEKAIEALESPRLALARAVERAARGALARRHPSRSLEANVEFYTAILLDAVGLPRTVFSPTFAAGRVAGWCAHVAEQQATGRLIRPTARYVGPRPS